MDEGAIKIRIIGSPDCERCQALVKMYKFQNIDFDYMDANTKENEDFCDKHNVETLPHIQAYYISSGEVLVNGTGFLTPADILFRVQSAIQDKNNPDQVESRSPDHKRDDNTGCGNCNGKNQSKS